MHTSSTELYIHKYEQMAISITFRTDTDTLTAGIAVGASLGKLTLVIITVIAVVVCALWTRRRHNKPEQQQPSVVYSNVDRTYNTVDDGQTAHKTSTTSSVQYDYVDRTQGPPRGGGDSDLTNTVIYENVDGAPTSTPTTTSHQYQSLQHKEGEDYTSVYTPLKSITPDQVLLEETSKPSHTRVLQISTPATSASGERSAHYTTLDTETVEDHDYEKPNA